MTIHYSLYADDFLMGKSAELFMLKSAPYILPTKMMLKGNFYAIGRILQLLEVQFCTFICNLSIFPIMN